MLLTDKPAGPYAFILSRTSLQPSPITMFNRERWLLSARQHVPRAGGPSPSTGPPPPRDNRAPSPPVRVSRPRWFRRADRRRRRAAPLPERARATRVVRARARVSDLGNPGFLPDRGL